MKVLVVGATGLTGGHAVRLFLARGDEVTAFVRDPAAWKPSHERLRVAKGEARDADSLVAAVKGQDAVLSAFGPRSLKKDDLQEVYMRNLLAAMTANGVKRLVNLSAFGAGDSGHQLGLLARLLRDTLLRQAFADKNRREALLVASPLEWVNCRPGRLLNAPARGGVRASVDPTGIRQELTREDLAAFMVEQTRAGTWVRKSPVVGY